jgi:hypothetical protein
MQTNRQEEDKTGQNGAVVVGRAEQGNCIKKIMNDLSG